MATVEQLEREIRQLREEIASGRLYVRHAEQHRPGGGDPHGIIVEETDGSPSATRVSKVIVTAGTLTDNEDGSVTIAIASGSGVTDHSLLSNVTANQHHAQTHSDTVHSAGPNAKASQRGAALGLASLDASVLVPVAEQGTGTASSSTYLRGDRSWAALPLPSTRIKRFTISFGMTAGTGYQI